MKITSITQGKKWKAADPVKPVMKKCHAADYKKRISKKAYELYQQRGFQDGRDLDDWFEAERIVEEELSSCE